MTTNYLNSSTIFKALVLLLLSASVSFGQTINTICGNGFVGSTGDGGPATAASIWNASGIFVTPTGMDVYFTSSENKVRKINGTTNIITTVAGTGTPGVSGDNGPATAAQVNEPTQVCVDAMGNVYIADPYNYRVRKVSTTGIITSFAGSVMGMLGDGGPATAALMISPSGIALDMSSNLYIADKGTHNIRMVNATTGIITSVAGVMTTSGSFSGDGGPAASASFNSPSYLCIDNLQNIYIADVANYRIRKINTLGIISTIAGNGSTGYSGDGGPATAAMISTVNSIYADNSGKVFIADGNNNRIRCINTTTGIINTVAGSGTATYSGDGGPATAAGLGMVAGLAGDLLGRLYIGDLVTSHRIRRTGGVPNPSLSNEIIQPFITSLYPNPSKGVFAIKFPYSCERVLEVTDVTGKSVFKTKCASTTQSIDITMVENGIYLLKITDLNGLHTQQIVVQH